MSNFWFKLLKSTEDFFSVGRQEARGLIFLHFLLIAIILAPIIIKSRLKPAHFVSSEDLELLEAYSAKLMNSEQTVIQSSASLQGPFDPVRFTFDPNSLDVDKFIELGLPPWLAARIIKYRQSGGQFRQSDDLLKIYGFPNDLYEELKPYIHISSVTGTRNQNQNLSKPITEIKEPKINTAPAENIFRDINSLDSLELRAVNGIGPVLSGRIVRYREALGGFISEEQLNEVYGLQEDVLNNLLQYAGLTPNFEPKRIPINTIDELRLAKHPYLNRSTARIIINYRNQHGPFHSAADLKGIRILSDSLILRITPYLSFEINENP
jgi:competence protein ComEA